jgi:glycosyltransferase involved in cell wall biosynthesis
MDISIIICTYNRAESLRRTLHTCCDLVIPAGVTWELLVVDNNSSEATKMVCDEFTGKLPLRYLFEPHPGKSFALNRGMEEAKGELLLFTDDDVDLTPSWLQVHVDAAKRYPSAMFFGGKVVPRWETPPPSWVLEHQQKILWAVTMDYNLADNEKLLTMDENPFVGANLSIKNTAFSGGELFCTRIGPEGKTPVHGEESDLLKRFLRKGMQGIFVPTAVVYHRNPPERAMESYVRRWYKGLGIRTVRLEGLGDMTHVWFGAPRYLWRQLVEAACRYALTRWTKPSGIWLRHEINMARTWGMICEHRRQWKQTRDKRPQATD